MRYSTGRTGWSKALEDATGGGEVIGDAPVANFEINVAETDEDGAPLETVDASGQPTVDVTLPETEDALDEVEDAEEVVDKLEETSEVLENYAIAIESRIRENGGLTPSEWELVQIGLRSRIKNIQALTPSKESFGYSRLSASNEALDAIKEGIKNVWEAIKKAIMGVINRVRKWWAGALSDAARLGKRATGIRENAKKKSSSLKNGDKTVKLNAKNMVGPDGKAMDTTKYVAAAQVYLAISDKFLKQYGGDVNDRVEALERETEAVVNELKNKIGNSSVYAGDSLSKHFNALKVKNVTITSSSTYLTKDNDVITNGVKIRTCAISDLPGNKRFVWTFPEMPNDNDLTVVSIGTFFNNLDGYQFENDDNKPREVDSDLEFKVLTSGEITSICEYIEALCDHIVKYKQDFERREKIVDKFVKRMDTLVRDVSREDAIKEDSKASSVITAYIRGSSNNAKNSLSNAAKLITELLSKSRDLLAYAQRSSAMYE